MKNSFIFEIKSRARRHRLRYAESALKAGARQRHGAAIKIA